MRVHSLLPKSLTSLTVLAAGLTATVVLGIAPNAQAQNLIANGDFSAGNMNFSSGYTYASTANAAQVYTITTNPNTTMGAGWGNYGDHTTGTGTMMLVNGGGSSATNFWGESVAVTPNSQYTFSGWVATSTGSPYANVSFAVNGTSLGSAQATSTQGQWVQFSGTYNSGAATTANLNLYDLETNPNQNDFTVDDLSFTKVAGGASSAPEPGALPFVALGALPLAGFLRSIRRSKSN